MVAVQGFQGEPASWGVERIEISGLAFPADTTKT